MSTKRIITGIVILALAVVAVVLVLALMGPSIGHMTNYNDAILGKWQHRGGGELDQFFQDGTVTATFGATYVGTYRFVDANTLRIDINGWMGSTTEVFTIKIDGNVMWLMGNGVTNLYDRIG